MKWGAIAALAGAVVLAALTGVVVVARSSAGGADVAKPVVAGTSIGGPFTLVDGHGRTVRDSDFRGRFMLIYFGYTHCPDACPTMLSDMANALDKLPAADRVRAVPIFITVDPERDTPAIMGDYAAAFGPAFVGLTGSAAALQQAETAYHVYAARHPLKNGDYAMDHSSILYVMGPDGSFVGVVEDSTSPVAMAQALRRFGV